MVSRGARSVITNSSPVSRIALFPKDAITVKRNKIVPAGSRTAKLRFTSEYVSRNGASVMPEYHAPMMNTADAAISLIIQEEIEIAKCIFQYKNIYIIIYFSMLLNHH